MGIILGSLIWLLIFVALAVPLSILAVVKLAIIFFFCVCKTRIPTENGSYYTLLPLSKTDIPMCPGSSWTKSAVNVGFVLRIAGCITVEQFRAHFANCFKIGSKNSSAEKYGKFYSFIVVKCGYAFRGQLDKIDLNQLIVKRSNDKSDDLNSLEQQFVYWMLEKYKENHPCWEILIIPVSDEETTIAFKIHHGHL